MNVKRKGNNNELKFAEWLSQNGIKAWRDSGSGGGNREKSDVGNGVNCHFECKAVKKLNLQKAWKQSETGAKLTQNTHYVVIHFDGMPENEWLMVMNNYDWLDMFNKSRGKVLIDAKEDNQKLKWKLRNLKSLVGEIDKMI